MARTKQTARKPRKSTRENFPIVQHRRQWPGSLPFVCVVTVPATPSNDAPPLADSKDREQVPDEEETRCCICGGNMDSFFRTDVGWSGSQCPPCVRELYALDRERRKQTNPRVGLFVPEDKTLLPQVVEIGSDEEKDCARLFGEAKTRRTNEADPDEDFCVEYEMQVVDTSRTPRTYMQENTRALRVAMEMNAFDLDPEDEIRGPVLFTGPGWTSLTAEEVAYFCEIANIKLRIP